MAQPNSPWSLFRPCGNCPFLRDGAIELAPGRLDDIIGGLRAGEGFLCHKAFYEYKRRRREPCAGAIIYLEKLGQPNQLMQVMQRLDAYPRERFLQHAALVIEPPTTE